MQSHWETLLRLLFYNLDVKVLEAMTGTNPATTLTSVRNGLLNVAKEKFKFATLS